MQKTLPAQSVNGTYAGQYVCNNQPIELVLEIDSGPDNSVTALFKMIVIGGKKKANTGTMEMKGIFDARTNKLSLFAQRWITGPPEGYGSADLTATLTDGSARLSCQLINRYCQPFELLKNEELSGKQVSKANELKKIYATPSVSLDKADGLKAKCACLLKWSDKAMQEFPKFEFAGVTGIIYEKTINLYADEYFIPVFGSRFEDLGKGERNRIVKTIDKCLDDKDYGSKFQWYYYVIDVTFSRDDGSPSFNANAKRVALNRMVRSDYQKTADGIAALQEADAGFKKLSSIEKNIPSQFASLWPSEIDSLKELVNARRSYLATSHIERQLAALEADEASYETAVQLQNLEQQQQQYFRHVGLSKASDFRTRIDNKVLSWLSVAIETEKQIVEEIGTGEEGIGEGDRWYMAFLQKFNAFAYTRPYAEMSTLYLQKRKTILAAIEEQLGNSIDSATEIELARIERRFLAHTLSDDPSASRLKNRITARKDFFKQQKVKAAAVLAKQQEQTQQEERSKKIKAAQARQKTGSAISFSSITDADVLDVYVSAYARDFLALRNAGNIPYLIFVGLCLVSGETCNPATFTKVLYYSTNANFFAVKTMWDYYISRTVSIETEYLDAYFEACKKRHDGHAVQQTGLQFALGSLRLEDYVFWGLRPTLLTAQSVISSNGCNHPGMRMLLNNLKDYISGSWDLRTPNGFSYIEENQPEEILRYYPAMRAEDYPALPDPVSEKKMTLVYDQTASTGIEEVTIIPLRLSPTGWFGSQPLPDSIQDLLDKCIVENKYYLVEFAYTVRQPKRKLYWYAKGATPPSQLIEYFTTIGPPVNTYPEVIKKEISKEVIRILTMFDILK